MESCHVCIELCEAIMDALVDRPHDSLSPIKFLVAVREEQRALCACALTCRAWRIRAQRLLYTFPFLLDERALVLFASAIRTGPTPPTMDLVLGRFYTGRDSAFVPERMSELFMHTFSNLRYLRFASIDFGYGPPLRILRIRLPFFTSVSVLQLYCCTFSSLRAMLDVVWACPNLTCLTIYAPMFTSKPLPAAGRLGLSKTCQHLRACRKLTNLALTSEYGSEDVGAFAGSVFGCAVTELNISIVGGGVLAFLPVFLTGSFPALRSIEVSFDYHVTAFEGGEIQSCLHTIAGSRLVPSILKTIRIEGPHSSGKNNDCCRMAVGAGEEVVVRMQRLPDLLAGLERLTISLDLRLEDKEQDPQKCAAYIHSVLPSMHNVLRVEYLPDWGEDWKLCALPTPQ